ncbi:hypothetical protein DPEC_G00316660 [Dallia pectoralis]|uniref:Uncharacterized protein n=1 Tax=Dallia pectoralis TaxID=75939 RepID=A0ACC2FCY1_DALPE|nr:hypothetical protein DPEC_G00316660 [Dallia pectoralis]
MKSTVTGTCPVWERRRRRRLIPIKDRADYGRLWWRGPVTVPRDQLEPGEGGASWPGQSEAAHVKPGGTALLTQFHDDKDEFGYVNLGRDMS